MGYPPFAALVLQVSGQHACGDGERQEEIIHKHTAEAEAGGGVSGWLGRINGEAFSEGFMCRGGIESFS